MYLVRGASQLDLCLSINNLHQGIERCAVLREALALVKGKHSDVSSFLRHYLSADYRARLVGHEGLELREERGVQKREAEKQMKQRGRRKKETDRAEPTQELRSHDTNVTKTRRVRTQQRYHPQPSRQKKRNKVERVTFE